jgi:anti-sigma factor RsiW
MLVDYADGRSSPGESSELTRHLTGCERCRILLDKLRRSLDLADAVWADCLSEAEGIRIPDPHRVGKRHWPRYGAIAASILLVVTTSVILRGLLKPEQSEPTFAEIERRIVESGHAARLLAATELLSKYPDAETIVKQQYQHIIEEYSHTSAAGKARLKMQ